METIDKETSGIELFAKFTANVVKYSILGGYVFFSSMAYVINRIKRIKNAKKS